MLAAFSHAAAQDAGQVTRMCGAGIQPRTAAFAPHGMILTAFDSAALWVYDIDRNRRYPLPETHPCGNNCRLSRDARWLAYPNGADFLKMRLDGTERTPLAANANDVEWWSDDTLLVWTPQHNAYLQSLGDDTPRAQLETDGAVSVQPGGYWGMTLAAHGDGFTRELVYLADSTLPMPPIMLAEDVPYFNASTWSPDGQWLVYAAPHLYDTRVAIAGAELFGVRPDTGVPIQLTDLNALYGAVRINGHALGTLSWSPDSTRIAFWVIELLGSDYLSTTGSAVIHVLELATRHVTVYCGFSTNEHTPNPPRLVWSPDGTHLAFGGNIPDDHRGYLLLALDTATGVLTELSEGVFPIFGGADVVAWGLPPP
jgi:hypothetical protein